MICKECQKEGKESRVYPGYASQTLLGWGSYYDEKGIRHSHDPNPIAQTYSCSNGHNWTESYLKSCSNCDYGKKLEEKK